MNAVHDQDQTQAVRSVNQLHGNADVFCTFKGDVFKLYRRVERCGQPSVVLVAQCKTMASARAKMLKLAAHA